MPCYRKEERLGLAAVPARKPRGVVDHGVSGAERGCRGLAAQSSELDRHLAVEASPGVTVTSWRSV